MSGQTQERELVRTLTTSEGMRSYHLTLSPLYDRRVAILFHDRTAEAEAARLRSDFVANVTHELRTPLTSIRGMIDTLRSGRVMNEEQTDRFLQLMDVESQRLERLVSDLLVLSDIEQNAVNLNEDYFDLTELANEVITQMEPYATEQKVSLKLSNSKHLQISASRDHVKQLLMNLIDNGIKYNRPGGTVTVSWSTFDTRIKTQTDRQGVSRLTFSVEDNGIGISEADQSRIFERFYRIDRSRSQEPKGTGLGLAIVKHIALLYNGDVSVRSRLGIGTTIYASLIIPVEKQT
jgi:two-component system phosphate regulon sensor histidine kinase PhoR